MQGKQSGKFKYIQAFPTFPNKDYHEICAPLQTTEGNHLCTNGKHIVIPWQGGGGPFAILPVEKHGKVQLNDVAIVNGHTGPIQDLDFSPTHSDLLMTASSDASICLWKIAEEELLQYQEKGKLDKRTLWSYLEPISTLKGHYKKVILSKWHPTVDKLLATTALNGEVRIWDIEYSKCLYSHNLPKIAFSTSFQWNYNGSLIGAIGKEKQLIIIDPRTTSVPLITQCHYGSRPQRIQWNSHDGHLITTGTTQNNFEREYAVYDQRNLDKPLNRGVLDTQNSVMWTHLDEVSNIFYVINRGNRRTQVFYYSRNGEINPGVPELIPLSHFDAKKPTQSLYFMPKTFVDCKKNEIQRVLSFSGKNCEMVSFRLPRKKNGENSDLYPPVKSFTPSNTTVDQWCSGTEVDPVYADFDFELANQQIEDMENLMLFGRPEVIQEENQANDRGLINVVTKEQIGSYEIDQQIESSKEKEQNNIVQNLNDSIHEISPAAESESAPEAQKPILYNGVLELSRLKQEQTNQENVIKEKELEIVKLHEKLMVVETKNKIVQQQQSILRLIKLKETMRTQDHSTEHYNIKPLLIKRQPPEPKQPKESEVPEQPQKQAESAKLQESSLKKSSTEKATKIPGQILQNLNGGAKFIKENQKKEKKKEKKKESKGKDAQAQKDRRETKDLEDCIISLNSDSDSGKFAEPLETEFSDLGLEVNKQDQKMRDIEPFSTGGLIRDSMESSHQAFGNFIQDAVSMAQIDGPNRDSLNKMVDDYSFNPNRIENPTISLFREETQSNDTAFIDPEYYKKKLQFEQSVTEIDRQDSQLDESENVGVISEGNEVNQNNIFQLQDSQFQDLSKTDITNAVNLETNNSEELSNSQQDLEPTFADICRQQAQKTTIKLDQDDKDQKDEKEDSLEEITTNVLGYWNIRGLGQAIRYQLVYLGVNFHEKEYTQEQMGLDLPKLPYFVSDDKKTHYGGFEIQKALAKRYQKDLLGTTQMERQKLIKVEGFLKELHHYLIKCCYEGKVPDQLRQKTACLANQVRIDSHGQLVLGQRMSYIDFNLFELLQFMDFLTKGSILRFYPQFQFHINTMSDMDGLRPFINSQPKCLKDYPFNHRFAIINNWPKVVYKEIKNSSLEDDVQIIQKPKQKYYKIEEQDEMVIIDMKGY